MFIGVFETKFSAPASAINFPEERVNNQSLKAASPRTLLTVLISDVV